MDNASFVVRHDNTGKPADDLVVGIGEATDAIVSLESLAALGVYPGVKIMGPYEVDYADFTEADAVKSLFTPAVGDVILAWWLNQSAHTDWHSATDSCDGYLGQGAGFDGNGTGPSQMGEPLQTGRDFSSSDFNGNVAAFTGNVYLQDGGQLVIKSAWPPWVCADTSPVRIIWHDFGSDGPATAGHDRITFLVMSAANAP